MLLVFVLLMSRTNCLDRLVYADNDSCLDALHRAALINDNEIENSCLHNSVIIKLFLSDTMLARQQQESAMDCHKESF